MREADLEFDNGYFDAAAFASAALKDALSLAAAIDHTLLDPEATRDEVVKLCEEAARYRFACAMVNPMWVSTAVSVLAGTGVAVGTVVGFPLGASLVSTLRQEATAAARLGARELDMVIPIGQMRSRNYAAVQSTIHGVVTAAHHRGATVKAILETGLLTTEEKLRAAEIAIKAGADFIQTCTGFTAGGATVADVALMRGVVGSRCGVKALRGIRTVADVRALFEAGANRVGASSSVAIVRELGAD
jgi:deoxyribose-phosphate aldolase